MTQRTVPTVVLIAIFAFASGASVSSQQRQTSLTGTANASVTAASGIAEIPFELVNNHLIVPLSVNGSDPLRVVLDTGFPTNGLALYDKPELEALGLDIHPSIRPQIGGAGGSGQRLTAKIALSERLSLPGLELDGERVIVMPTMPEMSGYHDGIIGFSLFGAFVVEIDYDHELLRLHPPENYKAPEGALNVPLELGQGAPYATVGIALVGQEPFDVKVHVDLGASHAISLNRDEMEQIVLPEGSLSAVIGRGISGLVRGEVGRIAGLEIGGSLLTDVVATFPVSEHQNPRGLDSLGGNLGSEILRRFNTTFDYERERMLLVPNRAHAEPFHYDRSGIRLGFGDGLLVEDVIAASPAAESGIEVGDVVTHLNGNAVSTSDYAHVREQLMGAGVLQLTIERAGQTIEKTLRLRRLI